jgi:hypothetical protein
MREVVEEEEDLGDADVVVKGVNAADNEALMAKRTNTFVKNCFMVLM